MLFTVPFDSTDPHYKSKVIKLHKQFAHADPARLKDLLRNAGLSEDQMLLDAVDEITAGCATCVKYKPTPMRPVVAFPR